MSRGVTDDSQSGSQYESESESGSGSELESVAAEIANRLGAKLQIGGNHSGQDGDRYAGHTPAGANDFLVERLVAVAVLSVFGHSWGR